MHWSFLIVTLAVLVAFYLDSLFGFSGMLKAKPAVAVATA